MVNNLQSLLTINKHYAQRCLTINQSILKLQRNLFNYLPKKESFQFC